MPKETSEKTKILIVEDEELMLRVLGDLFSEEGFRILEARDGSEALETALAEHPDVILLDILLPKMNGMEVLKKLRQDAWGKKVPVILLTNLSPDSELVSGLEENPPAYYLVKTDWRLEDVVEKVRAALASSSSPAFIQ